MATLQNLSTTEFNKLVKTRTGVVAVEFWAPWCVPCRHLGPIFEDLAQAHEGQIYFAKVNTDENQDLLMKHKIFGVPTVLLLKNGVVLNRLVGLRPKEELENELLQALAA